MAGADGRLKKQAKTIWRFFEDPSVGRAEEKGSHRSVGRAEEKGSHRMGCDITLIFRSPEGYRCPFSVLTLDWAILRIQQQQHVLLPT
jgi:hypothetical protein